MTTYHHLLETHLHEARHDASDEWVKLLVRAVIRDGGPAIEIGEHSVTPAEAAVLAQSLLLLAEVADPNYQNEPVTDPIEVDQWLGDPGANPAPTRPTFLVTDSPGNPTAVVDMDSIIDAGTKLAFRLSAAADDHEKVLEISARTLAEHGPKAFGYVAASALQVVVEEVLNPVLEVTEALGTYLRPGIVAIAEGRDPGAA